LGTATTPIHITKLMRQTDEVVFSFDGDQAGRTAAWRAAMNALPALTDKLKLRFMFLPTGHDPDSYVREFGKEQFEMEIKNAMPLSQYIIQHLSEANDLSAQEDKVKFLNEAEPILKQIQAPRLSLMLRKRMAELAEVTDGEMQSLLNLAKPGKAKPKAVRRQPRFPLSIKKRFALMALMKPDLLQEWDVALFNSGAEEDQFLQDIVSVSWQNATYKPAALLHMVKTDNPSLMREIERELHQLEDDLDFDLELDGARTQLIETGQQLREAKLLDGIKEKPLSALTEEEREMLKKLGNK